MKPATRPPHAEPTFVFDRIVHYCVANMPGAVARTSTYALTNATLPFALALADKGWRQAQADDAHLANGLNVQGGRVTHPPQWPARWAKHEAGPWSAKTGGSG